ncbi:hypothetical protein C900_01106 [Fulvivirga imtechensis AK7]|uniref:Uncharacterized protein n=1 Tax=Fulvivirga imtechensis AK7 TaxID=1237149 RepID=L8JZV1_9BACT|nr:pinensin family lanthipeptide [Fulvivirga imtechensis]ELR72727.1 hypothetical protein C900_01106 [Fulvivirga imtechensis AK7]
MKKFNLNQLKVQSFVTSVNGGKIETIKGGISGGACVPAEKYPRDIEWDLGTRGGCTNWENMCNATNFNC